MSQSAGGRPRLAENLLSVPAVTVVDPPRTVVDALDVEPERARGVPVTVRDPSDAAAEVPLPADPEDVLKGFMFVSPLYEISRTRVNRYLGPDGRDYAVKVFRSLRPDLEEVWARWELARRDGAPLVELCLTALLPHGFALEVMPYRGARSLADLLGGPPKSALTAEEVTAVVRDIDGALAALHTPRGEEQSYLVHRDVKPSNILVRSVERPFGVELTDTEIVAVVSDVDPVAPPSGGTQMYAAPEARDIVHHASDYWSLGITIIELASGRNPFEVAGEQLPAETIRAELAQRLPTVPEDIDANIRHLALGLVVRDSDQRFGHAQVSAWVGGELPDLPTERLAGGQTEDPGISDATAGSDAGSDAWAAAGSAGPGFAFAGSLHVTAESLAAGFQRNWTAAAEMLLGRDAEQLTRWLRHIGSPAAPALDSIVHRSRTGASGPDRLVTEVVLALDDAAALVFLGRPVDRDGMARLAAASVEEDLEARNALDRLARSGALDVLGLYRGGAELAKICARWPPLLSTAHALVRLHVPGGTVPGAGILTGRLLLACLSDDYARALADEARAYAVPPAMNVGWYANVATVVDRDQAAAHHAVVVLAHPLAEHAASELVSSEAEQWARSYVAAAIERRRSERLNAGSARSSARTSGRGAATALLLPALFAVLLAMFNVLGLQGSGPSAIVVVGLAWSTAAFVAAVVPRRDSMVGQALVTSAVWSLLGMLLGLGIALGAAALGPAQGTLAGWAVWGSAQVAAALHASSATRRAGGSSTWRRRVGNRSRLAGHRIRPARRRRPEPATVRRVVGPTVRRGSNAGRRARRRRAEGSAA